MPKPAKAGKNSRAATVAAAPSSPAVNFNSYLSQLPLYAAIAVAIALLFSSPQNFSSFQPSKCLFSLLELFVAADDQCLIHLPKIFDDLLRPAIDCNICTGLDTIPTYNDTQLDEQTFHTEHYITGKPCLIKNAARSQNWSALQTFSLEYFHQLYFHELPDAIAVQNERCQFFPYKTEFTSLSNALQTLHDDDERRTTKPWYIGWSNCDLSVAEHLRQHYQRPQFLPKQSTSSPIDWIFMGTPGRGAHLHVDNVGRMSWQAQIRGTKRWRLQPPRECFFRCARELQITVEPGDLIVVDTDKWYHATQVLNENDISITIGSEFS